MRVQIVSNLPSNRKTSAQNKELKHNYKIKETPQAALVIKGVMFLNWN